jgi:cytochrome P450
MLLNPFQRAVEHEQGIPVMFGRFPVVGNLPAFLTDPVGLQRRASDELGPLFWLDLGTREGMNLTVHAKEAFGLLKSANVESSHFFEQLELFFGRSLIVTDGAAHRHARSVLNKPFSPVGLQRAGVACLARNALVDCVRGWRDRPRVKILAETQHATLRIIFGILGVQPHELSQWRRQFHHYMLSVLPLPRFPGSPYWLARRARDWIDGRLLASIEQARLNPAQEGLLAQIVQGRDDEGERLSTREVLDNLRLMVMAGHETTASSLAWLLVYLASDRRLWERLCEEARGVDEVPTTPEQVAACPFAQALFREAVRIHPPVYAESRRLREAMVVGGHELPAKTILTIPLTLLAHDPQRYPEPLRFDPERWLARQHKLSPIETCQFGGGPHFCLGYHLAVLEGVQFAIALAKELSATGRRPSLPGGKVPTPVPLPLAHPPARTIIELVKA